MVQVLDDERGKTKNDGTEKELNRSVKMVNYYGVLVGRLMICQMS